MSPVRLIFAVDGDAVALISAQDVEMTLPPGEEIEIPPDLRGFWAEVRNADEEVLHRLSMPNPLHHQAEVFTGEPDGRPHWEPVEPSPSAFTIVVPSLPEADHVALIESELATGEGEDVGPPQRRVVATFSLRNTAGDAH
jgi:hypothetical protein